MITAQIPTSLQGEPAIGAPGCSLGVSAGWDPILLRAAFGQDEANHGTTRYPVDSDGLVQVPLEAVAPLVTIGGFVLAKADIHPITIGVLKLHHDDAAGCSYAGHQYFVDANGDVLVPADATSELLAHGFLPVFAAAIATASSRAKAAPSNRSIKG